MRLSTFSDYSLRVLLYLGERPSGLISIGEIAAWHEISESHLMKVVLHLGRCGYVQTVRGKGGRITSYNVCYTKLLRRASFLVFIEGEQRHGEARRAETALRTVPVDQRLLHRVQLFAGRQVLDREQRLAVERGQELDAGIDRTQAQFLGAGLAGQFADHHRALV